MNSGMNEANSFSEAPGRYALARPRYPAELFQWIAAHAPALNAAWDCATGNGQAALDLARFFGEVQATDISREQIGAAFRRPNIVYSARPAEATGFPDGRFDMIAVAQALHWFDFDRFWAELARVARPQALFCAWGYSWFSYPPDIERELVRPVMKAVEPFWADNNRILWNGYRSESIGLPFERLQTPAFTIRTESTTGEVIDYLKTWSAYKRACSDADRAEELEAIFARARKRLPNNSRFPCSAPLSLVAARI